MSEQTQKLWNVNYNKAMLSNFMLYFAFYLIMPLLPLYLADHFHTTKDLIGLILSFYTIAALVFRPFSGYVVDSFNRKTVLIVFYTLFFMFFATYLAVTSLLAFAIVRTLHGIPYGGVTVANSTVAIDVLPSSRRNEGIGLFGLSNNLSMAVAPTVGLALYHATNNFNLLFWVALIIAFIGLCCAKSITVPQRVVLKKKTALSLDRFFLTRAWLMAVNIAFFSFCWGVLSNYLAIYSREQLGITTGTGTYFMILSMGLFLSRLQGSKALRKGRITQNAQEGIMISLVGFILFATIRHQAVYYLSALLIGIGNGHMYPAFLNMFIKVAHNNERGTANSSILTAWDIGMGIGILLGGVIAEHVGYKATFIVVSLVNALGVILFFIATKRFYSRRVLKPSE